MTTNDASASPSPPENTKKGDDVICFCYQVTRQEIVNAILTHQTPSVVELIEHCAAGNGCNCCWNDLEQIIQELNTTP